MTFNAKKVLSAAALAACVCAPCGGVFAAETAKKDAAAEELAYIEALVDANMPDFAAPVIEAAKKKWPELGPKLKVLELQGDLRLGKFDAVQKIVDGMKQKNGEYWALRLSMADAYYARGMMPECRKIYQDFFTTVKNPGADILDFYVASGFKWAQICVREKNFDEAVRMYGELLKKPLPEERWCTVAMENVELLIRLAEGVTDPKQAKKREGYLAAATVLADKLLWKNELIIVFGKAIAMKAHIELLRGHLDKAQDLVNEYMPQLAEIHRSLIEQDPDGKNGFVRMSPMPECRYLLAKVMWDGVQAEAKQAKPNEDMIKDSLFGAKGKNGKRNGAGAFNHAINVFVKYPESACAANAGELAESIKKFVKTRYKKDIKTNISADQMKKVRQMQFQNAYEAYKGNDFAKAVKSFGDILVQFPETDESVGAVSSLADSYLNLALVEKNPKQKEVYRIETDAVEGYLAERFAGAKPSLARQAGDEVLRMAAKEHDAGALARCRQLYDLYFQYYPTHYNGAQTAISLASKAYKDENWKEAIHFYEVIANTYTNSMYYASSLSYLSICYAKIGDVPQQVAWLRKFADVTPNVGQRTSAQLQLALMQQKDGFARFAAASSTNEEARVAIQRAASISVIKAIKDFHAVATDIAQELAQNKSLDAKEKEKLLLRREQALFLEGESWQRLQMPIGKMSLTDFRKRAVKAFEEYLAAYPKGQYASVALMKIGTIWTAEKQMDEAQKALARLQENFPDSDEAKNSVPRLAKTLIEMGLKAEGVAQYKQMLATTGGKYTAGQFLLAGDALLEAGSWDVAQDAYAKCMDLAKAVTNGAAYVARCQIGQAKALCGAERWAEAHEALDQFIEKNPKSGLLVDANEMIVEVASEEGRKEKDDQLRMKYFNAAVRAIKKLRGIYEGRARTLAAKIGAEKDPAQQKEMRAEHAKLLNDLEVLDLRSGDVLVRKLEAEEAMGLKEQALATCGRAVVTFQAYLMAHEPTPEHPVKDMKPAQLENLERCYGTVLPLMAKLGKDQSELILKYGATYAECFPDGKHKTAVQNAINQAQADK